MSPLVGGGEGTSQAREEHARSEERHGARERAMYSGNWEGGQVAAEVMHWEGEGGGRGLAMLRRLDLIRDKGSLQE